MPIGPARMPILDHLGELRRRLTIIVVSLFAATMVMYFATPTVVDVLMDPIREYLKQLYVFTSLGGLSMRFSLAFKVAIAMCSPLVVYQVLGFFLPALKPNERRWVVPTVVISAVLFYLGCLFCYLVIVNPAFGFLIGESQAIGDVMPDAVDFINTELLLMIGFGICFQLPLIVFYLGVFHIVPYRAFRAQWRWVYVVMIVVCASVTPDANPVTLLMMYAMMIAMYEVSLGLTRFVIVRREGKEALTRGNVIFSGDDEDED